MWTSRFGTSIAARAGLSGLARLRIPAASVVLSFVAALTPAVAVAKSAISRRAPHSASAPCSPGVTTLCLNNQRFKVEVRWTDFAGNTGSGQAISLTGDTGYFWFFSPSNVELVVKVVDGRVLNSAYWVFYGALSNVAYTMTVTDSVTGSVKTYGNPSGTFGSVGDTSAFPAGSGTVFRAALTDADNDPLTAASRELALREALLPGGPAPAGKASSERAALADAGTCVPTSTSLCLNNGRFRVEVAFRDFAGKAGVGTAVGLTGDTGYFWFFSSNNVELTVKALDARVLNGRFWVFYGALSNVEYTMTVTDTLTGVIRTYANPSGRFASAGDTSGFTTGSSVAAQLDSARAVSAVIPRQGGSLSAIGANGTTFTLTLPAGALLSEEEITMTPVAAVDRLPFSGGFTAGVQLSPEGLQLLEPAMLVITTPAAIPADQEITFSWRGAGEEFALFPPEPLATAPVTISLFHLSGYGVGLGSTADTTAQQGHPPASEDDQLEQLLQVSASEERRSVRGGGTLARVPAAAVLRVTGSPAQNRAIKDLTDYFLKVLGPAQPLQCGDPWKGFIVKLAMFKQRVLRLTGGDPTLLNAVKAYHDGVYKLLATCFDKAYDTCKANRDPFQGEEMARYWGAILSGGSETGARVDSEKISRCMTFQLTFDSFIEEPQFPNLAGATLILRHQSNATVSDLTFANISDPEDPGVFIEELTYRPEWVFTPGDSKCSFTASGMNSVFTVPKITIDINLFVGGSSPPLFLRYDVGHPNESFTLSCPGAPVTRSSPRWRESYELLHAQEFKDPNFELKDWVKTFSGNPYATRKYGGSLAGFREITEFQLIHTPK